MNAKELIELNNRKREQLNPENRKYYEDMLVYIRLSYDKSEQETEEILIELLDHLLEAQAAGKSAQDVFGDNPRAYAEQIIGELPRMVTKKRLLYVTMAVLFFLAAGTFFSGIGRLIISLTGTGLWTREVYLGTVILKTTLSIPIALALLVGVIEIIRWTCFRSLSRVKEFLIYWLFGIVSVGIFVAVFFVLPKFGPVLQVPFFVELILGAILYLAAKRVFKAI